MLKVGEFVCFSANQPILLLLEKFLSKDNFLLSSKIEDAIRTQPYDLLSWSAAYFRCISNNIPAPTKIQFEENTEQMIESRCLTKEFLRVLVKQVNLL